MGNGGRPPGSTLGLKRRARAGASAAVPPRSPLAPHGRRARAAPRTRPDSESAPRSRDPPRAPSLAGSKDTRALPVHSGACSSAGPPNGCAAVPSPPVARALAVVHGPERRPCSARLAWPASAAAVLAEPQQDVGIAEGLAVRPCLRAEAPCWLRCGLRARSFGFLDAFAACGCPSGSTLEEKLNGGSAWT
ncbi:unnamed protein product [Coccothraustes coccothraustes]